MRKFSELSSYWSEAEGRVVEAWRRSGESATAFSRRHGLRAKRLVYWSKQLPARPPGRSVTFVPAAVVAPEETAAVIRAPGGIAIELASATATQIAAIASALAVGRPTP